MLSGQDIASPRHVLALAHGFTQFPLPLPLARTTHLLVLDNVGERGAEEVHLLRSSHQASPRFAGDSVRLPPQWCHPWQLVTIHGPDGGMPAKSRA